MALARVKVINPGDVILSADWNSEFNNILNNPITLVSPTTGAINFQTSVAHTNLVPSAIAATSGGGLPAAVSLVRGLIGTVTTSQTVTLSADAYLLQTSQNSSGGGFPTFFPMLSTAAFTVNVGTAGPAANGRDVAAAFSSTFVHVYAITTGAGSTTPAGIASTTPPPTGPVFPANYNTWTYLGTFPYSSASTTFAFGQRVRGCHVYNETLQVALTDGQATSETAVSLSSQVPAQALSILLQVDHAMAAGGAGNRANLRVVSGSDFWKYQNTGNPGAGSPQTCQLTVPNVSQQVFYLHTSAGGGAGAAPTAGFGMGISVEGYLIPNGDV